MDDPLWKEAINSEIDSIMGNGTQLLVDLSMGANPQVLSGYSKESYTQMVQSQHLKLDWWQKNIERKRELTTSLPPSLFSSFVVPGWYFIFLHCIYFFVHDVNMYASTPILSTILSQRIESIDIKFSFYWLLRLLFVS